ncbi:MAG: histidinol dehydrogenase, partial [Xanthobacteraceae bacterium]|nr:histidinol dehydrogenase [Xanthobacteraceae bacterium]
MPIRLDTRSPDFGARFATFLGTKREASQDVEAAVRAIVADVTARGDAALIALTNKFDRAALTPRTLRVSVPEIDAAMAQCDGNALAALRLAHSRIEAYHRRQLPQDQCFVDAIGVELGY